MRVVRVALPVRLDQLFDYRYPHGEVPAVGARVRVPLGRRRLVGVVVEHDEESGIAPDRLRYVDAVLDREALFPPDLFALCRRVARYYHHPLGEVLATPLPTWLRTGRPAERSPRHAWRLTEAGAAVDVGELARAPRQAQVMEALAEGSVDEADLRAQEGVDARVLGALGDKGWIESFERAPEAGDPRGQPGPTLNPAQHEAVERIDEAHDGFASWLLDGVTGSGKTEVYLTLVRRALKRGRQALVIVPEIGLTPQLMRRFRRRLGDRVGVLHSGLADGERAALWLAARAGDVDVVLGTRSAVWTPLPHLGLMVVDEEHDASLKQQDGLRYSARDVAVLRAQGAGIPVVLGSATPSLESVHNCHVGRYRRLELPRRATGARPPALTVVDQRTQDPGQSLSAPLREAVGEALERGEQVLLFLNRRGFAPVLMCQACGWLAECSRCDARLTLHQQRRELRCHHCDHQRPVPARCPECDSSRLEPLGFGTQRLEVEVREAFPDSEVLRLDRDTMGRRDAWPRVLDRLGTGRPCIVVGTQMLAKGHDYPNITLVGVINLDQTLFSSDFRATERAAQLLVQVAGRAGRAGKEGRVVVQSSHPDHPLFSQLLPGGYNAFAERLLVERAAAGYPPIGHMALLRCEASSVKQADAFLRAAEGEVAPPKAVHLLGPLPSPMERRGGRYRMQLIVNSRDRRQLQHFLDRWMRRLYALPEARRVRWSLDVDPADTF